MMIDDACALSYSGPDQPHERDRRRPGPLSKSMGYERDYIFQILSQPVVTRPFGGTTRDDARARNETMHASPALRGTEGGTPRCT
jgi:hypothetical protein